MVQQVKVATRSSNLFDFPAPYDERRMNKGRNESKSLEEQDEAVLLMWIVNLVELRMTTETNLWGSLWGELTEVGKPSLSVGSTIP